MAALEILAYQTFIISILKIPFFSNHPSLKTKLFVPDSPTSSLSDLPSSSESEREDLLVNQPIAEPKNGGVVKRDRWIPIATSSVSKNEKHKNTRKNTREMDEISRTNNDNELSNISSALPELPGFSGLEASLPPLDDELLSLVPDRDVSAAGIHQVHASTATSGQGELPSNPPTDPDFGADRHSSSSYSAHSDPLNGSRKFDGYYTRASGPEFLGNNSQQSMGNVRPSPDSRDISMMRFSLNAAAGTQEMIQNRVGREEMIRLSLDWNAREELAALDAPSRPQNIPMPNQGLHPAHHMAGSLPVLNNNNAGMPPPPLRHHPRRRALSATGPDGPRLRTSTPLSSKRLRNQPVPTPSSRKLERIREEQEKTPERDSRSAQDGPIFHARRGRDGTHPTRSPNQNPSTASSDSKPPPAPR
ncbi:hypothetical protein KEM48_004124 [Puccinia striiformis f. sp. tritici PST-130]|nr:hypothetical protein KEM48_004124 [Puccinia striiformis f. sp. tritici PST-130]